MSVLVRLNPENPTHISAKINDVIDSHYVKVIDGYTLHGSPKDQKTVTQLLEKLKTIEPGETTEALELKFLSAIDNLGT